ncbi:tyrosine-type recombinase/integrase [Arthrobacter subterraneus]|uniref:tyrosine-type recombinase/integrase n=1 Tax=Arthrobacter subterraneus TaxID=335973 RepID=UPI003828DFDE
MAVKKLAWSVTYSSASGKRLRNEYETEDKARAFAARQKEFARARGTALPEVSKLKPHRWEAGYQDNRGAWKTKRFDRRDEAHAFHEEQTKAVRTRTYVDPKKAQATSVAELYERWIARVATTGSRGSGPAKPETVQGYVWLYKRLIAPKWQDYPLSNIAYEDVSEWAQTMQGVAGETASANTRSRTAKQFSRMLDYAVGQKLLAANPAKDASGERDYVPRTKVQREPVYLTFRQLERLAACAGGHELLIRFTGLTGLRWGEVTALQVRDLDLGSRPLVAVKRAYAEVDGKLQLGVTKGYDSREVPLPASLVPDLARCIAGKDSSALVFTSAAGRPMRNSNFTRRYYAPARQLAGTAVATLQAALGVVEIRKGLALYGDLTAAAVARVLQDNGLEPGGGTGPELWQLAATDERLSDELRQKLLSLRHIRLQHGDMDFHPPVFHDLRHTAVSLYLQVTKNVKHVQRIAGHKDATTTLNTYADLFDDDFYDSAARLDGLAG